MDPLWFDEKIKNILNVKNNKLSWNIQLIRWVNVKEKSLSQDSSTLSDPSLSAKTCLSRLKISIQD